MRKKRWLAISVALCAVVVLGACAAPEAPSEIEPEEPPEEGEERPTPSAPEAETITWKGQFSWGPAVPTLGEGSLMFAEILEQITDGRLVVEMNPGGTIVPSFAEFDGVAEGTLDLGIDSDMYILSKMVSAPLFGSIPAGFEELEFLNWMYSGGGFELWQEQFDTQGYDIRICHPAIVLSPESVAWSRKPIEELNDFKGLKYRTVGFWGEILEDMGASVMTLPMAETYPALERNVLDAAEQAGPAIDMFLGIHEVCEYMIVPGIHQPSTLTSLRVNRNSWEALPNDLKVAVDLAADATMLWSLATDRTKNAEAMAALEDYGTEVIHLSSDVQSAIRDAAIKVMDEHAAEDLFFAKVLESQRAFHETWARYDEMMCFEYD